MPNTFLKPNASSDEKFGLDGEMYPSNMAIYLCRPRDQHIQMKYRLVKRICKSITYLNLIWPFDVSCNLDTVLYG